MRSYLIYAFALCSSVGASGLGCNVASSPVSANAVGGLNHTGPQRTHGGVNTMAYGASFLDAPSAATPPASAPTDTGATSPADGSVAVDAKANTGAAAADTDKAETGNELDEEAAEAGSKPGGSPTPATP